MKKIPLIRQGQPLTTEVLNSIINAINSAIVDKKDYNKMMDDLADMANKNQSTIDNFISKYKDVVENTPGLMDLLERYATLASMVNGTYIASIGSVNIGTETFSKIDGTATRNDFENEDDYKRAGMFEQYYMLAITNTDNSVDTLAINISPKNETPIWVELKTVIGPQGPAGPAGPMGPSGKAGKDGVDGQIVSIKGVVNSFNELLGIEEELNNGDAYLLNSNNDVALYVYIGNPNGSGGEMTSDSWSKIDDIRGPAGPQGEYTNIEISYSNYVDGVDASETYNNHAYMIISIKNGDEVTHIQSIKLTPEIDFGEVTIEEKADISSPRVVPKLSSYSPAFNKTLLNMGIEIPELKTVETMRIDENGRLCVKYRTSEEEFSLGPVVKNPPKILFAENKSVSIDVNAMPVGSIVIYTDTMELWSRDVGGFAQRGTLVGPQGPQGPVGTAFSLRGTFSSFGRVNGEIIQPSAGNLNDAYYLAEDEGSNKEGVYVVSQSADGTYIWAYAGAFVGPKGEPGPEGAQGLRGTRFFAGTDFSLRENGTVIYPESNIQDNAPIYIQGDFYLNTTTYDIFKVGEIDDGANGYSISGAEHIGNIRGKGITSITFDDQTKKIVIEYDDNQELEIELSAVIKDIKIPFTQASARQNIVSNDDLKTMLGKISKYQADLKPHAFTAPSTTQGTSTTTVPSDKLLRESSFARVYREATEIPGITYPVAIGDLVKAIMDANLVNCYLCITMNAATECKVTGLPVIGTTPQTYGTLTIITGSSALRLRIEYNRETNNNTTLKWIGSLNKYVTPYRVTWKQVIDDSSAQNITGVKTFKASPIVPISPSGPSAAVSKSYVDGALANPTILRNGDFFRNDNGIEVYSSPVASCINNFGFGLSGGTTGSYNATTRTLKSDTFETAGKYAYLYQYVDNPARLNGKVVTLSAKAASTTGFFLIQLWKTSGGTTTSIGAAEAGRALSKSVTVTMASDEFAAGDTLRVIFQTYGETVLDYIKLEIGSLATAYTPEQAFVSTNSPETITGVKTFATGATPLITDQPTTDLMAVNKSYVDGTIPAVIDALDNSSTTNALSANMGKTINDKLIAANLQLGRRAQATGVSSTALGNWAQATGEFSTALGWNANTSESEADTIRLGDNDNLSVLKCKVALTTTSDERDKADITAIPNSLDFIDRLTPITYKSNQRTAYLSDEQKESENYKKYGLADYDKTAHASGTKKGSRQRVGLKAQEIQQALAEVYGTPDYANLVDDNFHDLENKPQDVENQLTVAYSNIIPFLVGAIKELKAEIALLKGE